MHCYVTLSNEMHNKYVIPVFTTTKASSYKVRLCIIVLSVAVCTVGYVCLFRGDQISVDFVSLLSMIIYKVL